MHASSGESSGASFERSSAARSSSRPRRRSQRRMRFSTRAVTSAMSARVGTGPSRNAGGAGGVRAEDPATQSPPDPSSRPRLRKRNPENESPSVERRPRGTRRPSRQRCAFNSARLVADPAASNDGTLARARFHRVEARSRPHSRTGLEVSTWRSRACPQHRARCARPLHRPRRQPRARGRRARREGGSGAASLNRRREGRCFRSLGSGAWIRTMIRGFKDAGSPFATVRHVEILGV